MDSASKVTAEVNAETVVIPDSSGKYSLVIDTTGIPSGDYRIEGGGDSKVIHIGGTGGTTSVSNAGGSSSGQDSSEGTSSPYVGENAEGLEITPDIIAWYAGGHSLDPKNATQYAEAERQLRAMTSGGYWKVIAQGEPFTEKAGNCEDKYCLVRGKDACTTCRYEEMVAKEAAARPNNPSQKANISEITENITGNLTETIVSAKNATAVNATTPKNMSLSQGALGEKSFFNRIIDWILAIIGGWVR